MSQTIPTTNDFRESWGFPSDVIKSIPGARWYDTLPIPGTYSSGRPRWETVFMDEKKIRILERRPAMELRSKRTGRPYFVCARQSAAERKTALTNLAVSSIMSRPGREPLDVSDVFA